jgi:hypothetical protein
MTDVNAFLQIRNDPNYTPQRSAAWFQRKVKEHVGSQMNVLKHLGDNITRQQKRPELGTLCMYFYAPKYKDTLPFYDTFPLLLPFDFTGTHFTGINLHYLAPMVRYKLLERLSVFTTDKNYDENTKLKLSWQLLSSAAQFPEVQPAVKKYIFSGKHVKSNFMVIPPSDWKSALFLPTARFKKATEAQVHALSNKHIKRLKKS